ncbi:arf-GAP with Rho-GAP domain, ANK repeat and PH domain-containing protein 1 isoform X2 [Pungitius pungitius]|uniref:arf-GAP with Rho-GAP domain, ANK repeat and PH domain-containing protein 1 isoform X2 n=1 Tax=Pungitius pungitius TaxID=134920 RepID=UPI001887E110|nr:arf-GAP with Rho-GAP domain, ANK repeat and PH domain-containing protein 1 isoform X2 [Pungitius pungitius]
MTPPPHPVPKPRACYMKDILSSTSPLDKDMNGETLQAVVSNGIHLSTGEGAPPLLTCVGSDCGAVFPTLVGVSDIITTSIPLLAGNDTPPTPLPPPSLENMVNSTHKYGLAGTASAVENPPAAELNPASNSTPVPAANTVSLDGIMRSLDNIPSLVGIASNPAVCSMTPSPSADKYQTPSVLSNGDAHTDVAGLSQLVMSALEQGAGVPLPPLEQAAELTEDVCKRSPHTIKEQSPYVTVLACWASQDEADTDSSNEEEDTVVGPTPSSHPNTKDPSGCLVPTRPVPAPPRSSGHSGKPLKQKTPRAATIRVSRKKGGGAMLTSPNAVVRASWLDVWKGFRHNVLWATLDGQLISLWKKRTDHFSEVLFHVSSITNVKKQDKGRFSVHIKKKNYDFMAHNEEVQGGWVTSLLATRGQPSPAPPELHGPITIKDPRSRVYAAVWGHDLWIYPNKEGFQLGIASFSVPLNVALVKCTGKHSFSLITPYKSFNLSVDSSKELAVWLDGLSLSIRSALSNSNVLLRLWENPDNKVCGDCGSANPEWASVNLLLVICQACAGQHRALGSNLSKVRSLKMDNKVWNEPLIQLFVAHGNRLANKVWAPAVPAAEQLSAWSSDEERSKFIQAKYKLGCYRRVHTLAFSFSLMDQRLRQVVCGDNVEETMSLICSGAKVCPSDPQVPSSILLAERAGQSLQTELLRLNEYTDVPPYLPQNRDSASLGEEEEELHGKLEEDRFLFSLENESAACDVLDLREVLSVFLKEGQANQFEMVTLNNQLICAADNKEALLSHLVHILKVILPVGVSNEIMVGASAVSKVCVVDVGGSSSHSDAWLLLMEDGVSLQPVHKPTQQTLMMDLDMISHQEMDPTESIITMVTAERRVSLRFEEQHSCECWFSQLQTALTNRKKAPRSTPTANQGAARRSLYPVKDFLRGSVPPAIERCISHITSFGLNVDGVYRRCGLATKVTKLVQSLMTSPSSTPLESDEQGVLDAASALKQYVRQQEGLIPEQQRPQWIHAAMIADEPSRLSSYRRLLRQLPDDNRATLNALFGHFYMVQVFSQVNRMSAQNLAVVLVPTLFQTLNQDLLRLTREFIIHHTLLFLTPEREEEEEEEEQITVF